MAFLDSAPDAKPAILQRNRFSLLLLKPGEVYLEDVGCDVLMPDVSLGRLDSCAVRGRIKICTYSLVIDPRDVSQPLIRIPYSDVKSISKWTLPREFQAPAGSTHLSTGVSITTTHYTKMREDNLIRPYVNCRSDRPVTFRLCPMFISVDELRTKIIPLVDAWKGGPSERASKLEEIVSQHRSSIVFNNAWIEDLNETVVSKAIVERVTPLVRNHGRLVLTTQRLYFQPFNDVEPEPYKKFNLRNVEGVVCRRFLLRNVGLELIMANEKRLSFAFEDKHTRDEFARVLVRQPSLKLENEDHQNMRLAWQNGTVSNFEYLMYLNSLADRSFNDLTQYPVFPWVIADYTSDTLDLHDPSTFRDLSKPIGALNPTRLEQYQRRFQEMPEPKYLYGSHYSTPGYVLYYTLRVAPEYCLCMQSGNFDVADRLFRSMDETWQNVLVGASDVKELIPEFYMSDSRFLRNLQGLDLGVTQAGNRVNDVVLPSWAEDADDFLYRCRQALESDYVSENLHHWIDLIFGYKQRGSEAVKADNVFHYMTYEGAVDLDEITDPIERHCYEVQILEFGQTPKQLFQQPHPPRRRVTPLHAQPRLDVEVAGPDGEEEEASSSDVAVTHEPADGLAPSSAAQADDWSGLMTLKHCYTLEVHNDAVKAIAVSPSGELVFSVAQDGCLRIHNLETQQMLYSDSLSDLALSSCHLLPDGRTLVVGSWDGNVYFFDTERYVTLSRWQGAHVEAVSHVQAFGGQLLTCSWDTSIKVWKMPELGDGPDGAVNFDAKCLHMLQEHACQVTSLDVNERRMIAASAGSDGRVIVWNAKTWVVNRILEPHFESIHALRITRDGTRLVTSSEDETIKVTVIESDTAIVTIDLEDEALCLSTNDDIAVCGTYEGFLSIWDIVSGKPVLSESRHGGPIESLCITKQGKTVVTASRDASVALWKQDF